MTDYYVNPAIGNAANDGTVNDADHAWDCMQTAIDGGGGNQASAGDTVYCVAGGGNDETPDATIDFDGNVGSQASGFIQFIGVNGSAVDDGTRYVIEGSSVAAGPIWEFANADENYYYFKNFDLNNAAEDAFGSAASHPEQIIFDNMRFHNPTADGCAEYLVNCLFHRCHFTGGVRGYYRPWNSMFLFCVFADNSSDGCTFYHASSFYGCLFHNNGGDGVQCDGGEAGELYLLINCISDGNTADGVYFLANSLARGIILVLGCRLTNNLDGIDDNDNGYLVTQMYNFILNNSSDAIEGGNQSPISGTGTLTAGTEGYNDRNNNDFNLTSSATLRRTAIDLGYGS